MKINALGRIVGGPPTSPKPVITIVTPIGTTTDGTPTITLHSTVGGKVFFSDGYVTDIDIIPANTNTDFTFTEIPIGNYPGFSITVLGKPPGAWYYTSESELHPAFEIQGLLFDTYPGATGFSLRKLRDGLTKAIRVRRDSDDTELDIGFDGSDLLDQAALLSFVGAGNGYVSVWYNQATGADEGNPADPMHAVQTTLTKQPLIVSAGVVETTAGSADGISPDKPGINFNSYNQPAGKYLVCNYLSILNNCSYVMMFLDINRGAERAAKPNGYGSYFFNISEVSSATPRIGLRTGDRSLGDNDNLYLVSSATIGMPNDGLTFREPPCQVSMVLDYVNNTSKFTMKKGVTGTEFEAMGICGHTAPTANVDSTEFLIGSATIYGSNPIGYEANGVGVPANAPAFFSEILIYNDDTEAANETAIRAHQRSYVERNW